MIIILNGIDSRRPPFVAPRHPRLDHIIYYFGLGFVADDIGSTIPSGGRHYHYAHPRAGGYRRLAYCLMERNSPVYIHPPLAIIIPTRCITRISGLIGARSVRQ